MHFYTEKKKRVEIVHSEKKSHRIQNITLMLKATANISKFPKE